MVHFLDFFESLFFLHMVSNFCYDMQIWMKKEISCHDVIAQIIQQKLKAIINWPKRDFSKNKLYINGLPLLTIMKTNPSQVNIKVLKHTYPIQEREKGQKNQELFHP